MSSPRLSLPVLDRAAVHVWTASLRVTDDVVARLAEILSGDERARADRFRTLDLRRRFIVARALMRRVLAAYVRADPASLQIGYGRRGKPWLQDGSGVCFNLSHAGDFSLFAVVREREVGVDIEAMAADVDCASVARLAFSPEECEALAGLPPVARREAFFEIWVRKEAYVKARGEGLAYPTRSFSVSHVPGRENALVRNDDQAHGPGAWRVTEIAAPQGFKAAVAASGTDWSVVRLDASAPIFPSLELGSLR